MHNTGTGLAKHVRIVWPPHPITTFATASLAVGGEKGTHACEDGAFLDNEERQDVTGTAEHAMTLKPGERVEIGYRAMVGRAAADLPVETRARVTCRTALGALTEARSTTAGARVAAMAGLSPEGA